MEKENFYHDNPRMLDVCTQQEKNICPFYTPFVTLQ